MRKKALFLYYSQAGQTRRAVEVFLNGLSESMSCDVKTYSTDPIFPFPWSMSGFFAAFPRCHAGPLPKLVMPQIDWDEYDVVILAYQVWFLAPSLPFQAFLQSPIAMNLRGKEVLTLVTCRNLWHSAWRKVCMRLAAIGTTHLGQITLCERSPLWASFITTPRWMLTGKKNAFAFFPPAGIADGEFQKLASRARALGAEWTASPCQVQVPLLECNLQRVSLTLMDRIGNRFFRLWSRILQCVAPQAGLWQNLWLIAFRLTLIALIILAAPCTKLFELCVKNDPRWILRFMTLSTDRVGHHDL